MYTDTDYERTVVDMTRENLSHEERYKNYIVSWKDLVSLSRSSEKVMNLMYKKLS